MSVSVDPQPSVILVKERNETHLVDPYETAFQDAGYSVSFLPALEFVFINQSALHDRLLQHQHYTALVATSPRGASAGITALAALASTTPASVLAAWQHKPFYVVGEGSAGVIARSALQLSVRAVGGNAERLGAAIAADCAQSPQPSRLLVLSGNLRRDELFTALAAARIPHDELTVYETRTNQQLRQQWQQLAHAASPRGWVCYFSPSGVAGVKQCVDEAAEEAAQRWMQLRVAALGQTSASAVAAAGWTVHAVAASPSPTQLLAAIQGKGHEQQLTGSSGDTEHTFVSCMAFADHYASALYRMLQVEVVLVGTKLHIDVFLDLAAAVTARLVCLTHNSVHSRLLHSRWRC